jgi:hypothetical protein
LSQSTFVTFYFFFDQHFLLSTLCPSRQFFLSSTFCPSHCLFHSTFCPIRRFPFNVLFFYVFYRRRFLLRRFVGESRRGGLDPDNCRWLRQNYLSVEAVGIMHYYNSPWSSPLHLVPKPDGSWHPCGNYRHPNLATAQDHYPLPILADFGNNWVNADSSPRLTW